MDFLSNLSIKVKLLLLALIPLLGLLYFAIIDIQDKWQISAEMDDIRNLSSFAVKASALVHETQKERGATAVFLASKGTSLVDELAKQKGITDQKIVSL